MSSHPFHDPDSDLDRMDLVSWTFGNQNYDQDKKIYIDADNPERSLSASQARRIVRKLVAGFQATGLKPRECVCVHAFNDIMYTMLFLGIIGAGGRFTGSNPAYTPSELSHHIQITDARFLITELDLWSKIKRMVEESSVPSSKVFILGTPKQDVRSYHRSISELLHQGETEWFRFDCDGEAKSTTAALLSTSGTTGLPKAAMISHYSLVTQNNMLNDSGQKPYKVSRLISLPEFHAFAFPIAHISPLREGNPTYIMRRFELSRYLTLIDQYEITETPMVPSIMNSIVKQPSLGSVSLLSLRLVWTAGAFLDERTQSQMYRLLVPSARVVQVWGMTEIGWITSFKWPEKDHTGSVGRLLPGMEARFVAEDGSTVDGDFNQAEVHIRGPTIMQGYLGNVEASNDTVDTDGWLKTGDIGFTDHGKIYIVDRKKEMIKVRGWQVSPAELEAVLMVHPDILDAAIVAKILPNSTDEAPCAYIVRRPGSNLNTSEIKDFMSTYLVKYKSLDGGVVFTDSIPKNPAGKILRKVLKERAQKESQESFFKKLISSAIVKKLMPSAAPLRHQSGQDVSNEIDSTTTSDSGYVGASDSQLESPETRSSVHSERNCDWSGNSAQKSDNEEVFRFDNHTSNSISTLSSKDDLAPMMQQLGFQEEDLASSMPDIDTVMKTQTRHGMPTPSAVPPSTDVQPIASVSAEAYLIGDMNKHYSNLDEAEEAF